METAATGMPEALRPKGGCVDGIAAPSGRAKLPSAALPGASKGKGNRPRNRRSEDDGTRSLLFGWIVQTGSQGCKPLGDRESSEAPGFEWLRRNRTGLPRWNRNGGSNGFGREDAGGTEKAPASRNRFGRCGLRLVACRPGPIGLVPQGTGTRPQGFGQADAAGNRKGLGSEGPARQSPCFGRGSAERTHSTLRRRMCSRGKRSFQLPDLERRTERGFGIVPGAERTGRLRPAGPWRNGGSGRRDADRKCFGFGCGAIGRTDRASALADLERRNGKRPRLRSSRRTGSNGLRPDGTEECLGSSLPKRTER